MRISAPEYPWGARFITNGAGFRNTEEVAEARKPTEIRILSLEDSFATGMGADQAEFYGAYLAEELRRLHPDVQVTVLNAEVSDPSHGLYYLQEYGMKYRPHIVLYTMCGNDVMQASQFAAPGGLFTLQDDGPIAINSAHTERENPWDAHGDFAYPAAGAPIGGASLPGLNFARRTMANADQLAATKLLRRTFGFPKDGSYFSYAQKYEARDGRLRLINGTYNLGFFYRHGDGVVGPMYDTFFSRSSNGSTACRASMGRSSSWSSSRSVTRFNPRTGLRCGAGGTSATRISTWSVSTRCWRRLAVTTTSE